MSHLGHTSPLLDAELQAHGVKLELQLITQLQDVLGFSPSGNFQIYMTQRGTRTDIIARPWGTYRNSDMEYKVA